MKGIPFGLQLRVQAAKEKVFKGFWVGLAERAQRCTFPKAAAGGFAGGEDITTDFEVEGGKSRGEEGEIWFRRGIMFDREVGGER